MTSTPTVAPLLDFEGIARLRTALEGFTADGVHGLLGLAGQAALARGDLAGVRRLVPAGERLGTLINLFLLGRRVDEAEARAALAPLPLQTAQAGGVVEVSGGSVRALLDIRPYAQDDADAQGEPWWVVSDFGSDVRSGPLSPDHVLGVGAASLTLAQATIRTPVRRALDVGTGCGIQSLHLSRHSAAVTATDISVRALRLAATTAALSGAQWDLRAGSLLEPVAGERFDLVVANPPFVVSPGLRADRGGYDYRDSGLAGDGVCHALLRDLPGVLAPGGVAQLLANWIIPTDGTWEERIGEWLAGRGCDAWVWQREVAEAGEYVTMWLRDAGEVPGSARWEQRYDDWLDWFAAHGVAAVGMGLVTLWQTGGEPVIRCEDVPQPVEQPAGAHIGSWIDRQRWLAATGDDDLLATPLRCADGVVRTGHALRGADGWRTELQQLRQSHGMRWELEVDDSVAGVVGACTGAVPLRVPVSVLAASLGVAAQDVAAALLPTVRDLVARGFLEPPAQRP